MTLMIAVPDGLSTDEANAYRDRIRRIKARSAIGESPMVEQCEHLSAGITLVTALSLKPKHVDVQSRCLDSWLNIGCRIVAQNTTEEIEQLTALYPQVHDWVACDDVSTDYDYPTQRLYNLAWTSSKCQHSAIINSDIEILCSQRQLKKFLNADPNEFVLGIRWNYQSSPMTAREFEWGIDLITVNVQQLSSLPPEMPFAIGQPMWDYALPELLRLAGHRAKIPHERVLFHRDHPQHWSTDSHRFGQSWLSKFTGQSFDDVRFRKYSLDPDYIYNQEQGKYLYNHWQPLHRYGPEHATDWDPCWASRWYHEEWLPQVPAIGCSCQPHWAELTAKHPPVFTSAREFFEWSWARHDDVSRIYSKRPLMPLAEAFKQYWPDLLV